MICSVGIKRWKSTDKKNVIYENWGFVYSFTFNTGPSNIPEYISFFLNFS